MENKTSKRIKLLIAAVLLIFLAMVVIDVVSSGAEAFKRGFEAGMEEDSRTMTSTGGLNLWMEIKPVDPDAGTRTLAEGVEFTEILASGELEVTGNFSARSTGHVVVTLMLSLLLLAATVAFIVSLAVFACKFTRGRVLTHGNVVRMRRIAASLGALGAASYGLTLDEYLWLRGNVVLEGYRAIFPTPPSALIVALILWAMAEIMNFAGRLQTEQDLTV